MNDRFAAFLDFFQKVTVVTPDVIADLQKLIDDAKRVFVNATGDPATTAELVAAMVEGNRRVQDAPRFLVNALAKRVSQAVTDVVRDDETVAAAILGKLQSPSS